MCDCTFENGWQEIVGGEYMVVAAGVWDESAGQRRGVLMVTTRTLDNLKETGQDFYDAPLQAGKLRVIAANGLRLTVEAANGQRSIFDLNTRTWIDPAPGSPSYPTITPLPTFPGCSEENARLGEECRAQQQQTREAWAAADALTPTRTPLPTVTPIPTQLALGIFNNTDLIWPTSKYIFTNGWRDHANNTYLTIFAGGYRDNPQQGVIFVIIRTDDYRQVTELTFYGSPVPAGSLRITAADGSRLTLTATNNQQFIFDVATRQWVNP